MRMSDGRCCKLTDSCNDLFIVLLVVPILSVALVSGAGVIIALKVNASAEKIFPNEELAEHTMDVMKENKPRIEDAIEN